MAIIAGALLSPVRRGGNTSSTPGITALPSRRASFLASSFAPARRITDDAGPMKPTPARSIASTSSASSAMKP
jgi:hypothetical protein